MQGSKLKKYNRILAKDTPPQKDCARVKHDFYHKYSFSFFQC